MHEEIGGYFEIERSRGREYHANACPLNSGRSCLRYLIQIRGIRSVWLPSWICDSVIDACLKEKVKIQFYCLDKETLKPIIPSKINADEWLYIVNYFGKFLPSDVLSYTKLTRNLIVDNAQAFFAERLPNIDTLYTCRKFFGVPDGGYLYTDSSSLDKIAELERDQSCDRVSFLFGRLEKSAAAYFEAFRENEKRIDDLPVLRMSLTTQNLLKDIDYDFVFQKRSENFAYLHERLGEINELFLRKIPGAYMYPLLVKNGFALKKELIKEKIYVPTLWPNTLEDCHSDDTAYRMSKDAVFIPCDQRYGKPEMEFVCDRIRQLLNYLNK